MKTSEAFRGAKKHLWDGHSDYRPEKGMTAFICIAARRAMPHPEHDLRFSRLEGIIKELLDGDYTLPGWLKRKGHVPYVPYGPYDERRMQVTRHAWLDHLIEHYESIGD